MVTSVPYQLRSSEIARERELREDRRVRPGDLRRGQRRRPRPRPSGPAALTAGRRPRRPAPARGASRVGERFDAEVGPVAHGGHCVVRLPAPRGRGSSSCGTRCRASGSSSRSPRAPRATGSCGPTRSRCSSRRPTGSRRRARSPGPGACGGCDFQHVVLAAPARLKADVVARAAGPGSPGSTSTSTWSRCPGDQDGLRWRTRQRFVPLPDGGRGMRKHRSHDVVEVDDCLIAGAAGRRTVVRGRAVRGRAEDRLLAGPPGRARDPRRRPCSTCSAPRPGESVLDLYAGVGLFARVPGRRGRCRGRWSRWSRGTPTACRHARRNVPGADVLRRRRRPRCWRRRRRPRRPGGPRPAADRRQAGGRRAGRRPAPARGRLRRLRPGRAGPRRRDLRRARLPARRRCGPSTCSR